MSYGLTYEEFYRPNVEQFKSNSKQAYGRCPFHEDNHASLSMNLSTGQFRCHGCQIVGNHITFSRKLGIPVPTIDGALITPPSSSSPSPRPVTPRVTTALKTGDEAQGLKPSPLASRVVCEYVYEYEDGSPAHKTIRLDPKSFRQAGFKNGQWVSSMEGVRRVPFRLPQILKTTEVIYLVEGEKDVITLEEKGLVATTTPMGAGAWNKDYAKYFTGKFVAVLPDNDEPGRLYACNSARDITAERGHVKICTLPGLPEKGDVTDFFNNGGSAVELISACQHARPFSLPVVSTHDPLNYFRELGVTINPAGTYLPSEFKLACKEVFEQVAAKCNTLTAEAEIFLGNADAIWKNCTSPIEFNKFLNALKKMHEASL